jgi:VWFA-related protein
MSLDFLNKKAKNDKRVLLVISDGEDNASRAELENVVRELQEQEKTTTIYAVGLLSDEERRSAKRAERALKYIARATGGPSYFPETVDEVQALTKRIAADIRNQYTITYTPAESNKAAGFRSVRVELEGKAKRNQVRHRPGYYAQ